MASSTIRDVAKQAGVGIATVSRVLNNNPSVSHLTRQKVLEAIETLNFAPNLAARRLSRGKTMTIGVVVPFFTNPSVVRRLQGIVSVLSSSEYDLMLFDIETAERRDVFLHKIVRREMVDALLILSLNPTDADVAGFEAANLPVVLVDAHHSALHQVVVNNVIGGYQATKHLIDLGHHRIAYLSDYLNDPFTSPVRDRYTGYRQALAEANIEFCPSYHKQGKHGRFEATQMAHELLTSDHPPTAIFAYSDTQAFGILRAAQELGLKIPQHLSVIGYDNIETAEFLHLTTIRQHLYESGVQGAELLLQEIAAPLPQVQIITLPTELVVRETTAPPALSSSLTSNIL